MPKPKSFPTAKPSSPQELTKWSCSFFGDKSEIDVFIEATGQWETVAEVYAVGGLDPEDIATFIVETINERKGS